MTSDELFKAFQEIGYEKQPTIYDSYFADSDGEIWLDDIKIEKYINGGYYKVCLYVGGNQLTECVHVLVCTAFHGERPEGLLALHADDNRLNNLPDNLYWGTGKQNGKDAYNNGRCNAKGSCNGAAKFTEDDVIEIKKRLAKGETQISLAREFNVSKTAIWDIKAEKNWKEVK